MKVIKSFRPGKDCYISVRKNHLVFYLKYIDKECITKTQYRVI